MMKQAGAEALCDFYGTVVRPCIDDDQFIHMVPDAFEHTGKHRFFVFYHHAGGKHDRRVFASLPVRLYRLVSCNHYARLSYLFF
jgi:hypothetical protein